VAWGFPGLRAVVSGPVRSRCVHRNPAVSGCARTYSGQRPGPAGGTGSGLAVPMPAAAGPRRVSGAGCGRSLMVAVPGRAGVRGAAGGRAGSFRNARASGRVPGLHERWRVHIGAGQVRYGAGRRQRAARCPLRPRPSRRVAAPLTGLPRTGGVPRGPAWVAETSRRARSWAIHGGCSADLGRRARGLRVRCSEILFLEPTSTFRSTCWRDTGNHPRRSAVR